MEQRIEYPLAPRASAAATSTRRRPWTAEDIPDQRGRIAIVTGANSGLGFLTSLELARRGAHVIMTARDPAKGRAAWERIRAALANGGDRGGDSGGDKGGGAGSVELRELDLADLDQVQRFSERLWEDGIEPDLLVNNAGVMMPPRTLTRQGHELQFGVNHLAHFALAALLWPRMRRRRDARIVTVSSDLHKRGEIHFDDLAGERRYGRVAYYAQSKFANVLFALELDRRFRAAGVPVKSLLAHPGYAATNLQLSGPSGVLKLFMRFGNRFIAQPAAMGVLPQLHAATAPHAESGQFIGPDGRNELRGYPTVVEPIARSRDATLAAALWRESERLAGVRMELG